MESSLYLSTLRSLAVGCLNIQLSNPIRPKASTQHSHKPPMNWLCYYTCREGETPHRPKLIISHTCPGVNTHHSCRCTTQINYTKKQLKFNQALRALIEQLWPSCDPAVTSVTVTENKPHHLMDICKETCRTKRLKGQPGGGVHQIICTSCVLLNRSIKTHRSSFSVGLNGALPHHLKGCFFVRRGPLTREALQQVCHVSGWM